MPLSYDGGIQSECQGKNIMTEIIMTLVPWVKSLGVILDDSVLALAF